MADIAPDFELPNVAAGPDPFSLHEDAAREELHAVVLCFQRDYHCRNCRQQVTAIAERHDAFESRGARVVSVLPEPRDRAQRWQDQYDLPFPLLADPETAVSDDYDQPSRFGILGELHDLIGRMPEAVVIDATDEPTIEWLHEGSTPADRPSVETLLERVDAIGEAATEEPTP